jgi:hypothetical protein
MRISQVLDGDGIKIGGKDMRLGFEKEGFSLDAYEMPKYNSAGELLPYIGQGDSSQYTKWARHSQHLSVTRGIPVEDVTPEMLHKEAEVQRKALISLLTDGHNVDELADDPEIEVDIHTHGTGVRGRSIITLRNTKTGKIINQEMNTPELNGDWYNAYNKAARDAYVPPFDADSADYDMAEAEKAGMVRGKDGHMGSVRQATSAEVADLKLPSESYLVLKGKNHETWDLMEEAEKERGFKIIKKDGRYWSVPEANNNAPAPAPTSAVATAAILGVAPGQELTPINNLEDLEREIQFYNDTTIAKAIKAHDKQLARQAEIMSHGDAPPRRYKVLPDEMPKDFMEGVDSFTSEEHMELFLNQAGKKYEDALTANRDKMAEIRGRHWKKRKDFEAKMNARSPEERAEDARLEIALTRKLAFDLSEPRALGYEKYANSSDYVYIDEGEGGFTAEHVNEMRELEVTVRIGSLTLDMPFGEYLKWLNSPEAMEMIELSKLAGPLREPGDTVPAWGTPGGRKDNN